MAHFAKLNENNIVTEVHVVANSELLDANGVEQEHLGQAFLENLFGGTWKQTSYNGNIRKNYAGIGYTFDTQRDAFIPPKPYASWVLNEETCRWEAPVSYPDDGNKYEWNEETISWTLIGEQNA